MGYIFSYKSKKFGPEMSTLRPYAEVYLEIKGRKTGYIQSLLAGLF